jgi:hypothetical protein
MDLAVGVEVRRRSAAHALTRGGIVNLDRPAAAPNGCLIEAPWLVHGGHGASLRQPFVNLDRPAVTNTAAWHARAMSAQQGPVDEACRRCRLLCATGGSRRWTEQKGPRLRRPPCALQPTHACCRSPRAAAMARRLMHAPR